MKKGWIGVVFLLTFILSVLFSCITNIIAFNTNTIVISIIILIVIAIGIIFDMIGTSVLTSKEANFHAMGSKKIRGAKEAVHLIRNNVKVSSICNDIIGDICGVISGGLGAVLTIETARITHVNVAIITVVITALISALTVGGKAIFKGVAIKNADKILFNVSKIICIFKKQK